MTKILEEHFGKPLWKGKADPLSSLIRTILSQSTNDRNRDLGYRRLRERFPTWEQVREATIADIAEAIRPAGLANQKSQRIKNILEWVHDHYGSTNLDGLCNEPADQVMAKFLQLKGVGIKTLSVVLMFACGVDIFPVDTHVHRICRRIGLVPGNASAEKTHHLMQPLVPPGKSYSLHINLIRLGRVVCKAQNPRCHDCPLVHLCDSAYQFNKN